MKNTQKIGSKKTSLALFGASLCGFLSLAAACSGQTQPLNSMADGGAGGSSGSGGMGGSGGSTSAADSGGAGGNGGSTGDDNTSTDTVSTASGGSGGGSDSERDVLAKKLDILFVVDNSINMGTKQPYLATAAAELLGRLADPDCVDGDDPALVEGCPEGQQREFAPVMDMHVGVISSSLGGHGGQLCSPQSPYDWNPTQNDAGNLMPRVRDGLTSYRDWGFLAWNPLDSNAEYDIETLQAGVVDHIRSVGEIGCGYEAPLESMYRFLIDPFPPEEIVVIDDLAQPTRDAAGVMLVDTQILEQRADFLRPDSALAIVLLSDEDDCSVQDSGIGWLTTTTMIDGWSVVMPASTTQCEDDPNDPCCRSCGLNDDFQSAPDCPPLAEDPRCSEWPFDDSLNLRCFEQRRRFGYDFLYPTERYVEGLTQPEVVDRRSCTDFCPVAPNPLFPPEDPTLDFTRRASEVFVVSVVGVPWQDLATPESLSGDHLTYRNSFDADDWSVIVGSPSQYIPPEDPLMVASPRPRSGTHPITGEPIAPETSNDPTENSINGHELADFANDRLQYACTFPLMNARSCTEGESLDTCECGEHDLPANSPLCQPPEGGPAEQIEYFAGATPGLRQLEVMSKLPNGVPASICPKLIEGEESASSYGYNPAMRALVRKMRYVLE